MATPIAFRHVAPSAQAVFLAGELNDWDASATAMARQPDGSWTVTVALDDGQWLYKFVEDGRWVPDGVNPLSSPDGHGSRHSWVLVGDGDFRVHAGVPHGRVETLTVPSPSLGSGVDVNLYVPPVASRGLPFLVLVHGSDMDRLQWTDNGLIPAFMDNLLARKAIAPFLVAMPSLMPFVDPTVARDWNTPRLFPFLRTELPAFLAKHHGARGDAGGRALGGFSMGGGITLGLAADQPDAYGLWLPFAAAFRAQSIEPWTGRLAAAGPILSWCGREDELAPTNRRLADAMKGRRSRFEYRELPGGHSFRFLNAATPPSLERASGFFA